MKSIVLWSFTLGLVAILGAGVAPVWANACGGATVCLCGDTVVTDYNFPANLTCGDNIPSGEPVNGLIVEGGVHVNLEGFKLTGTKRQGFGLRLKGCGGSIQNGGIRNFDVGIDSDGPICDWQIKDIAVTSNVNGVLLHGDHNTVERITCSNNGGTGLTVQGDNNFLGQKPNTESTNRCERNGGHGIYVDGNGNTLIRNLAGGNGGSGVLVIGDGNDLQKNQGRSNADDGIRGIGAGLDTDGRNYGTGNRGENCHIDGHPTTGGGKYC